VSAVLETFRTATVELAVRVTAAEPVTVLLASVNAPAVLLPAVVSGAFAFAATLAYPGQPYQIEVYAPRQAVQLVASGAVRPAA
jgi:hypothetical protein